MQMGKLSRCHTALPFDARSLYIHIPFCSSKCRYCDFNSIEPSSSSSHDGELLDAYVQALMQEIEAYRYLRATGGVPLATCHIGGGTPTVLGRARLSKLVERVQTELGFDEGAEITVEANPASLDSALLGALCEVGVNRISIGVQSLADRELSLLGRRHSAAEATSAIRAALAQEGLRVGLDLIYGLPSQSRESWMKSLVGAVDLAPASISAYALTLEDGTPMALDVEAGRLPVPDDDTVADMADDAARLLCERGYRRYEVSNWAVPGCESRHNMTYWNYCPYLAVGAGACGFNGTARYTNITQILEYIRTVRASALPVNEIEVLSEEVRMFESTFMGLRMVEGICLKDWEGRFGRSLRDVYHRQISHWIECDFMECDGVRIRLTHKGMSLSNLVFSSFAP